jgi:hypothetical protein
MSYQQKVYRKHGGAQMVVASGGSIKVETGGTILPNSGTQPAHIANASVAHDLNATFSDTEAEAALNALGTKLNSVLAALRGAGVIASS